MTVDTGGDRQRGTAHGAPAEPEPIDWQAERHWNDRPWVQVALALVIAGGVAVVLNVLLRDAWGRSSGGTGGFGGFCAAFAGLWSARRVRRQVAEESGLSPWQVPIVGRWLRKGRVPADPKARRAMAALARQQRRASQRSRWSLPVLMTLFAVGVSPSWRPGTTPSVRCCWRATCCWYRHSSHSDAPSSDCPASKSSSQRPRKRLRHHRRPPVSDQPNRLRQGPGGRLRQYRPGARRCVAAVRAPVRRTNAVPVVAPGAPGAALVRH